MKVKNLKTGKVEDFNDGYAMRLIEQGKAVTAQEPDTEKEEKAGETPAKSRKLKGEK